MEQVLLIVQNLQTITKKVEKRLGVLESDVSALKASDARGHAPLTCKCDVIAMEMADKITDMKDDMKKQIRNIKDHNQTDKSLTQKVENVDKMLTSKLTTVLSSIEKSKSNIDSIKGEINQMKMDNERVSKKMSKLLRLSLHGDMRIQNELCELTSTTDRSTGQQKHMGEQTNTMLDVMRESAQKNSQKDPHGM